MSKKESFIKIVQAEIFDRADIWIENYPEDFEDAKIYFEALKGETGGRSQFTKNGAAVLKFIQENVDIYNNLFKAKDIGEGMGISSRTASGAMRKLVTDGWLEKLGQNPTTYSLTDKGINVNLNVEN